MFRKCFFARVVCVLLKWLLVEFTLVVYRVGEGFGLILVFGLFLLGGFDLAKWFWGVFFLKKLK